jgi:hypothetical protein
LRWDVNYLLGSTGDAVVNVYINQEKKFAFVEMRTVEEASNAMALDGIIFEVICKNSWTWLVCQAFRISDLIAVHACFLKNV